MENFSSKIFSTKTDVYHKYVQNITKKFFFDENICHDLTQEIIIKLISATGSFINEAQFKSYVYLVAKNHCINFKNKSKKIKDCLIEIDENIIFNSNTDVLSEQEKNQVSQFIEQLPDILASPLCYHYYSNLKYEEIAQIMSIPIGTVKSRINSAKKILKVKLKNLIE